MSIEAIGSVVNRNRLRWFGHVRREERKRGFGEERHVCILRWSLHTRPREGPRKTWLEVVTNDMKGLGLASADVLDPHAWKKKIVLTKVCPG